MKRPAEESESEHSEDDDDFEYLSGRWAPSAAVDAKRPSEKKGLKCSPAAACDDDDDDFEELTVERATGHASIPLYVDGRDNRSGAGGGE